MADLNAEYKQNTSPDSVKKRDLYSSSKKVNSSMDSNSSEILIQSVTDNECSFVQEDSSDISFKVKEQSSKEQCDEEGSTVLTEESNVVPESIDISPNKDGGITKQILRKGNGYESPQYGYTVSVRYNGYTIVNGSVEPLICKEGITQIVLGKGTVVPGLEVAISSMKKNEVSLFVVQPKYGYGEMGIPKVIPPYSILCFEVELVDWKYEDLSPKKDEGILRKMIEKGEGSVFPNEGASVKIKIIGYSEGLVFDDREVEFILGEGITDNIPEGVEHALFKFRQKETSIIYLKPRYAFDPDRYQPYRIPSYKTLEYHVKLLSFEKAKDIWEMNSDEKYEKSKEARMKGVNYFKEGHYKVALRQFKKIIACLEKEPGVLPESEESRRLLLVAGYNNCVMCYKKLGNYIEAAKLCDKVLVLDPENEKALYQRGQCHMLTNDCDDALEDFQKLLIFKPESSLYKKSIEICREKMKQQHIKDKALYSNMFEKLAFNK